MSIRKLYYSLAPSMRMTVRKVVFFPIDLWETITNKRHPYQPPRGEIYIGSGDFIAQGKHQMDLLQKHIQLKADDAILDIGSGIGRTAIPLTTYLSSDGKYEGFDVVEKGVRWCQSKISKDFPNFNFQYVPLNNDLYTSVKQRAEQFTFPYEDGSFNKAFLFSVFTHMQPVEVAHYLKEIQRVLKVDGRCLATFFVYNNENENFISNPNSVFPFPVKKDGYRLMDAKVTSANIAFHESVLQKMIEESGLVLEQKIEGYWRDKRNEREENSFQDVLVLSNMRT